MVVTDVTFPECKAISAGIVRDYIGKQVASLKVRHDATRTFLLFLSHELSSIATASVSVKSWPESAATLRLKSFNRSTTLASMPSVANSFAAISWPLPSGQVLRVFHYS